jgi:hypothetical protein
MSAPGSIEFNKDIFFVVNDFLLERFSNKDSNGFFLFGWDFFRFKVFGKRSSVELVDKVCNGFNREITRELEFRDILRSMN